MIKCAIFDLDGTLIDSMGYWHNAPVKYLEKLNKTISDEMIRTFFSLSLPESAKVIREYYNVDLSIDDICKGIDDVMEYNYMNYIELKPNVLSILDKYKELGIKMAIASSTDRHLILKVVNKLGLDKYFELIATSTEVGKNKTHTDIYDLCRNHFNCSINESVIFEDLPYGIICCSKAGYHTIGILDIVSKEHWKVIKENAEYSTESFDDKTIEYLVNLAK